MPLSFVGPAHTYKMSHVLHGHMGTQQSDQVYMNRKAVFDVHQFLSGQANLSSVSLQRSAVMT